MIHCSNLSIGYGSDIIQSHISFDIKEGDYVCIIGENGAGKTTLVKTLLGLIPHIAGDIAIEDSVKAAGIGYLSQQGVIQRNFPTSVREVILSGKQNKIRFFYKAEDKESVKNIARRLDIEELLNKRYSDLSGGQQQRVLLARALFASEKLLVLDEPVTGLDIKNQQTFYDIAQKINKEGTTILMISHDIGAFSQGITHVLRVDNDNVEFLTVGEYEGGKK